VPLAKLPHGKKRTLNPQKGEGYFQTASKKKTRSHPPGSKNKGASGPA